MLIQRRLLMKAVSVGLLSAHTAVWAAVRDPEKQRKPSYLQIHDHAIRDALLKARDFHKDYESDLYLNKKGRLQLRQVVARLRRLQYVVGYGHFNLLSFDEALKFAANYATVGAFSKSELVFIDYIFNAKASSYGFFGEKVTASLTASIAEREVLKVPYSGHYLYRGDAVKLYLKLRKDIGSDLVLTSGIRSVVKQLYLFLNKTVQTAGNLSRAARQLAPPGHSFHGVGDFDVGQRNWGAGNFTAKFSSSAVYKKMHDMGYDSVRYPQNNPFGVRYEPWHIKVVKNV